MSKYRVTYCAVKRNIFQRFQSVHGVETKQLETMDDQIAFREEKTVEVEADSPEKAIAQATAHLPKGCDVSPSVHLLSKRGASA